MRSIGATVLLTILLGMLCFSSAVAEGLVTLNVDIPAGQWKAARLKNLPKDALVAVQVVSNGEITVALLHSKDYQHYSKTSRPLFAGRLEKRLAFSVSIPAKGDYYLVLDNHSGREPRSVTVTVRAARAGAGQAKSAEEILKKFEQQLHQIFVFKPFPIGIKQCGAPQAFVGTSGMILCAEYVHYLYDILRNKARTQDTLSFSLFHEVARLLLSQWNHPSSADSEVADEFATVLMIMFNQEKRLIAAAGYFIKNPSVSETFSKLFMDERHPLSASRAQNILKWAKDPQTALKWQKVLVPRMQTSLLKRLKQQPTSWTDLSLVEKELVKRRGGSRTEI